MWWRIRLVSFAVSALAAFAIGVAAAGAAIGTISIDRKATLSHDRMQATVIGTIVCSLGDEVNMFANVTEVVGRLQRFARNPNLNTLECTGEVQPWSVLVTVSANGGTIPLVAGPANAGAFAFDQTDFTQGQALGTVLLVH